MWYVIVKLREEGERTLRPSQSRGFMQFTLGNGSHTGEEHRLALTWWSLRCLFNRELGAGLQGLLVQGEAALLRLLGARRCALPELRRQSALPSLSTSGLSRVPWVESVTSVDL